MEREAELDWIRRFLTHLEAGTTELSASELELPASIFPAQLAINGTRSP